MLHQIHRPLTIDEFCSGIEEKKEQLFKFVQEKLNLAGDINLFPSRLLLKNQVSGDEPNYTELVDEMCESFLSVVNIISNKLSKSEKHVLFSYTWLKKIPEFLDNTVWFETFGVLSKDKGDDTLILSCISEAIFDFAHEQSMNTSNTQISPSNTSTK